MLRRRSPSSPGCGSWLHTGQRAGTKVPLIQVTDHAIIVVPPVAMLTGGPTFGQACRFEPGLCWAVTLSFHVLWLI